MFRFCHAFQKSYSAPITNKPPTVNYQIYPTGSTVKSFFDFNQTLGWEIKDITGSYNGKNLILMHLVRDQNPRTIIAPNLLLIFSDGTRAEFASPNFAYHNSTLQTNFTHEFKWGYTVPLDAKIIKMTDLPNKALTKGVLWKDENNFLRISP